MNELIEKYNVALGVIENQINMQSRVIDALVESKCKSEYLEEHYAKLDSLRTARELISEYMRFFN